MAYPMPWHALVAVPLFTYSSDQSVLQGGLTIVKADLRHLAHPDCSPVPPGG